MPMADTGTVLVLDIDGVVVGGPRRWHAALKEDLGLDYAEIQRDFFAKNWGEVVRGRLDLFVALHEYFGATGRTDRIEAFVNYWFEKDAVVDHALLADVAAWRRRTGGRVFAASNQEHHRVAWLKAKAGLDEHFDEIVYSAALGVCKPDRVFFTNAQARMGVQNSRSILFVDDSPANVDGARALGWRAVLYRGRDSLNRVLSQVD
jgi:putative hydrolase of the HAD superfamily